MADAINPSHYKAHPSGYECIAVAEHFGFSLGNAIKYLWRAGLKGAALEDLQKARWYLERAITYPRQFRADLTRAGAGLREAGIHSWADPLDLATNGERALARLIWAALDPVAASQHLGCAGIHLHAAIDEASRA